MLHCCQLLTSDIGLILEKKIHPVISAKQRILVNCNGIATCYEGCELQLPVGSGQQKSCSRMDRLIWDQYSGQRAAGNDGGAEPSADDT